MKEHKHLPEVIEKSEEEISEIIQAINASSLSAGTKAFVIKCIELAIWFPTLLQRKNISLSRLCTLLFGRGYKKGQKKSDKNKPDNNDATEGTSEKDALTASDDTSRANPGGETKSAAANDKKSGHGRMPHTVYKNCNEVQLDLEGLSAGDACPFTCGGVLRRYNPGIIIRIKGQNFAHVIRYTVEKLRCALCGYLTENYPNV